MVERNRRLVRSLLVYPKRRRPASEGERLTLQQALVDLLWIGGIAGLLATFSFAGWRQRICTLHRTALWRTPSLLFPVCISLAFICSGALLAGAGLGSPDTSPSRPIWELFVWGILFIFFIIQAVVLASAGEKHGWDSSTERIYRHERPRS